MVTVKDGTSYFPIGGGLADQGLNVQAVIETDRQKIMFSTLEKEVTSHLESWRVIFENHVYKGGSEIEASLSIEETDYIITFPKYGFSEAYELK